MTPLERKNWSNFELEKPVFHHNSANFDFEHKKIDKEFFSF
jgi:hypothetical protein